MIIWKDVHVRLKQKVIHCRKIGGRIFNSFIDDYGDIPVLRYNDVTKKFEAVENLRGTAYAARKRLKYRKNKKNEELT